MMDLSLQSLPTWGNSSWVTEELPFAYTAILSIVTCGFRVFVLVEACDAEMPRACRMQREYLFKFLSHLSLEVTR